jgi:hypothetical protein
MRQPIEQREPDRARDMVRSTDPGTGVYGAPPSRETDRIGNPSAAHLVAIGWRRS